MKKLCLLLLAIIFFLIPVSVCSEASETSSFNTARQIGDSMENRYGVTILIGPECASISGNSFTIGDQAEGRTPFLKLMGAKNYDYEIQIIDSAFSFYPSGFFEHFISEEAPKGLRVLLADQILYEGTSMAGVTTINDGYYNIFLGVGAFTQINVHHEIWHAIEFRILYEYPDAFDNWHTLNPDGFEYTEDYTLLDKWDAYAEKDDYFVRGYSTIDETEDRATIIESLFLYNAEWRNAHHGINRKYQVMMDAIRPVFGDIYTKGDS